MPMCVVTGIASLAPNILLLFASGCKRFLWYFYRLFSGFVLLCYDCSLLYICMLFFCRSRSAFWHSRAVTANLYHIPRARCVGGCAFCAVCRCRAAYSVLGVVAWLCRMFYWRYVLRRFYGHFTPSLYFIIQLYGIFSRGAVFRGTTAGRCYILI